MGKAQAAATTIWGYIDTQTKINAVDVDPKAKRIDPITFKGEIEFKDVWFRYPNRKNDWILKGLDLKILRN